MSGTQHCANQSQNTNAMHVGTYMYTHTDKQVCIYGLLFGDEDDDDDDDDVDDDDDDDDDDADAADIWMVDV